MMAFYCHPGLDAADAAGARGESVIGQGYTSAFEVMAHMDAARRVQEEEDEKKRAAEEKRNRDWEEAAERRRKEVARKEQERARVSTVAQGVSAPPNPNPSVPGGSSNWVIKLPFFLGFVVGAVDLLRYKSAPTATAGHAFSWGTAMATALGQMIFQHADHNATWFKIVGWVWVAVAFLFSCVIAAGAFCGNFFAGLIAAIFRNVTS
jgi:hypothetical protein